MKFHQETHFRNLEISILAGNSRVNRDEETGLITVQPQIAAFKAALLRAIEIKNLTQVLPTISIALDHRGTFRKQFLLDGLTNSQKRHPKLAQLRAEIVAVFQPIADELGIPLTAISIIHEDSARTHASHVIQTGNLPTGLMRLMKADQSQADDDLDDDHASEADTCGVGSRDVDRVTCAAVTSEYFLSSLNKDASVLEVFFENDIWSQPNVYTRGAVVMKELGSTVDVRLRIVDKSGVVLGAKKSPHIVITNPIKLEPIVKTDSGETSAETRLDSICQSNGLKSTRTADFGLHAVK